jgi:hypothetical protein
MDAEIIQPKMTKRPSKPLKRELTDTELVAAMHDKQGDDLLRKEEYRLAPQNATRKDYGLRERESSPKRARKPQAPINRPFANCWGK